MTERPKDACTGCYSEPCICDTLAESVGAENNEMAPRQTGISQPDVSAPQPFTAIAPPQEKEPTP